MSDDYSYTAIALTNINKHPYIPTVDINIKIGEVLEVSSNGYFKTSISASDVCGSCFIPVQCLIDKQQVFILKK